MRIAAARILEARALLGVTRADQLPEVNASASAVNARSPQAAGRPAIETSPTQVALSAAWELDFWGKFRRATESARATVLSEEWAQRQMAAANAQIGVAKADYFPHISLTATGGFQSSALSKLFSGPAGPWSIGAGALQPVFDGGRIRNRVKFAEARAEEVTLVYQRTVQQAFRETRFFTAQVALAQAQLRELQSLVQLYRSLGGGWQP